MVLSVLAPHSHQERTMSVSLSLADDHKVKENLPAPPHPFWILHLEPAQTIVIQLSPIVSDTFSNLYTFLLPEISRVTSYNE